MTKKHAYQNEEKRGNLETNVNHQPLPGKVVLLVGNDTAVMHLLIGQLAQRGADIALLCRHLSGETARRITERAQSFGRKLLLIEQEEGHNPPPAQLVQTITSELGQLDLFIDLSAQTGAPPGPNEDHNQTPTSVQPLWQITTAVLNEIMRSETARS